MLLNEVSYTSGDVEKSKRSTNRSIKQGDHIDKAQNAAVVASDDEAHSCGRCMLHEASALIVMSEGDIDTIRHSKLIFVARQVGRWGVL